MVKTQFTAWGSAKYKVVPCSQCTKTIGLIGLISIAAYSGLPPLISGTDVQSLTADSIKTAEMVKTQFTAWGSAKYKVVPCSKCTKTIGLIGLIGIAAYSGLPPLINGTEVQSLTADSTLY